MRVVTSRTLHALVYEEPPDPESWRVGVFGLTPVTSRVTTYAGLVMFLAVNSYLVTRGLLDQLQQTFRAHGSPLTIVIVALAVLMLAVTHEGAHLLFHPDRGRSSRSIAGVKAFGPFVLYNGPMSRRRFIAYLLGPLAILTPITIGIVIASGPRWPLYANLCFAHLAMTFGDLALAWRFLRNNKDCREVWNAGRRLLVR